jgi:hypothetical protein
MYPRLKKSCRKNESCGLEQFDRDRILERYRHGENQKLVQAAAALVDNGRAGTLNRLHEESMRSSLRNRNAGYALDRAGLLLRR